MTPTRLIRIVPEAVDSLYWPAAEPARIWFIQPHFDISADSVATPGPGCASPKQLFDAVLQEELRFDPLAGPTILLMPELSISVVDIEDIRTSIARARTNSLFVFGVSPLSDTDITKIEPALARAKNLSLWPGPSEGRSANCAVVGVGGSDRLYLQPKIVSSRFENDRLWCGTTVRYFKANHFRFCVLVCSDLLDRPEEQTVPATLVNEIRKAEGALELCLWVQYNGRPRSPFFFRAITAFERHNTTVLTANTRRPGPRRFENHSVSGAIVPHHVLPGEATLLSRRFHYVEPISTDIPASRLVLLRYDADVYRVCTVRGDAIHGSGVEKSALFSESQPYVYSNGVLTASNTHQHLHDLSHRAAELAARDPLVDTAGIAEARAETTALWTYDFIGCLDVATMPNLVNGRALHGAGELHRDGEDNHVRYGDFLCQCWRHRECLDLITDQDLAAEPLAQLLRAIALMKQSGLTISPRFNAAARTNAEIRVATGLYTLGVVYAYPYGSDATRKAILTSHRPSSRPRLVDASYLFFGTGDAPARTPLAEIRADKARSTGQFEPGREQEPIRSEMFEAAFIAAYSRGQLRTAIETLLVEGSH